jgi:uncharacterized integral membrane protein
MIHVGVDLTFSQVKDVLAASVLELERNKEKIANPGPKDDVEQVLVSFRLCMNLNISCVATSINIYIFLCHMLLQPVTCTACNTICCFRSEPHVLLQTLTIQLVTPHVASNSNICIV